MSGNNQYKRAVRDSRITNLTDARNGGSLSVNDELQPSYQLLKILLMDVLIYNYFPINDKKKVIKYC